MNILIINAFGKNSIGKKYFNNFYTAIKTTFKSVAKKNSNVDNFFYTIRTPENLDDFIFDYEFIPNEGSVAETNKKNFDKMDFIFIDGTEKYIPWADRGLKLSEFIKLCKSMNKLVFCCGVALESLIYYLATGAHNEYNFINSNGELQSVEDLTKIPKSYLKEIKKNDNFLDFVTGDVLEYRNLTKSWVPIMNIGLHKIVMSMKHINRGKYVIPDNFIGKDYIKNNESIVSSCNEIKVEIVKQYNNNYLVKNLPGQFTVYSTLTWFPHYFNVAFQRFQFKAIGNSLKGPVLIEHENSVGCAFHCNKNYKESLMILENFIENKYNLYKTSLYQIDNTNNVQKNIEEIPLMFRGFKLHEEQLLHVKNNSSRPNSTINKVSFGKAYNRVKKFKKDANDHVGFSFNNRDMIFVENNSINQGLNEHKRIFSTFSKEKNSIKNENDENNINENQKIINNNENNNNNILDYEIQRNKNTRISEIFNFNLKQYEKQNAKRNSIFATKLTLKQVDKAKENIDKGEAIGEDYMTFVDKEKMDEDTLINYYKKVRRDICEKLEEIDKQANFRENNNNNEKKKNRNKNKEKKINNNIFIKNNINEISKIKSKKKLNANNIKKRVNYRDSVFGLLFPNITYNRNKIEEKVVKKNYDNDPLRKWFNTTIETEENEKKMNKTLTNFKKPKKLFEENNPSLTRDNEYITMEERRRREFVESKKKWVTKEDFHRVFGLHTTSIKPIINTLTGGEPISKYKYRDIFPEKWLTSNGFV